MVNQLPASTERLSFADTDNPITHNARQRRKVWHHHCLLGSFFFPFTSTVTDWDEAEQQLKQSVGSFIQTFFCPESAADQL